MVVTLVIGGKNVHYFDNINDMFNWLKDEYVITRETFYCEPSFVRTFDGTYMRSYVNGTKFAVEISNDGIG